MNEYRIPELNVQNGVLKSLSFLFEYIGEMGNDYAMQHLMNLIWPNLFETSPHVINAVMGAIEGMRCCLGPTKVLQYTLQGLFHPARKVRDVYWKVYNNLYIGSQAGLVPAYPRIGDDVLNQYQRTHLELFL